MENSVKFSKLKILRVTFAALYFTLVLLIFTDFSEFISLKINEAALRFQFIPSVIKTVSGGLSFTSGFIVIITVLFGRVYCSFICPLGIFMDITSGIKEKFRKTKQKYLKEYKFLRCLIFFSVIIIAATGSLLPLKILDPYSIFGRTVTYIFRPLIIGFNNLSGMILESADLYLLNPVPYRGLHLYVLIFSAIMFITIVLLTIYNKRIYCNTICPVGTFLGIISKYSFLGVRIDKEKCVKCGICEAKCKSSCINVSEKNVDNSRCVTCFNCTGSCKFNAIKYSNRNFNEKSEKADKSRKNFLLTSGLLLSGASSSLFGKYKTFFTTENYRPEKSRLPLTPPGSKSLENYRSKCTACYKCVSSCPGQVLQPVFTEYGAENMLIPSMNYNYAYCNYNCHNCGAVCPTGAIEPLKTEQKQKVQIGIAVFVRKLCVVIKDHTECGACSEHCPTKAVTMIEEDGVMVPFVKEEICIGCGACEYACPARPKAIYVEANETHARALKPKAEKLEFDAEQEFPF